MAGKKGMKRYPIEIRKKAVKMLFEEGYRKSDIRAILCIRSDSHLVEWFD